MFTLFKKEELIFDKNNINIDYKYWYQSASDLTFNISGELWFPSVSIGE